MNTQDCKVSVVVPTRNEKDHIEDCLRSILDQRPPAGDFEIIVADGMSTDGTREILARMEKENPRLHVIDNPARIVSTGLNEAIKAADGTIIVRMDAHTQYASDYIYECVQALETTAADSVGGPWTAKGAGVLSEAIAAAFQCSFAMGGARAHDVNYTGFVDTVYLGCWRREVFDRVGLFDPELVRNQDDEFHLRLTRAGGKIWQSPRIRSWYTPRGSLRAVFKQYMQYGYWKVRVIQKHTIPAAVRHLIPGLFVCSLIVLPLISIWWNTAVWLWLAIVGMYVICTLAASVATARHKGYQILPVLPVVFAMYHFGYGYGFLRGIWHFVVLRRKPPLSFVSLTRVPND